MLATLTTSARPALACAVARSGLARGATTSAQRHLTVAVRAFKGDKQQEHHHRQQQHDANKASAPAAADQVADAKKEQPQPQQAAVAKQQQGSRATAPSSSLLFGPSSLMMGAGPALRLPSLFHEMQREVDALLGGFGGGGLFADDPFFFGRPAAAAAGGGAAEVPAAAATAPLRPLATDVTEDDKAWTLRADVPGLSADDVRVTLQPDGVLTISGERSQAHDEAGPDGRVVRRERAFSSFRRSFALPEGVDADGITAATKDGVLTVVVPKPPAVEPPAPKQIEVRRGDDEATAAEPAAAGSA